VSTENPTDGVESQGALGVLECVVNVSCSGPDALGPLLAAVPDTLLDVHDDPGHDRSVLTLAGERAQLGAALRSLARATVETVDLAEHDGPHPRFGVLDVVPFVPLDGVLGDPRGAPWETARAERDAFARWLVDELGLPSFFYGPERSLPEARALARRGAAPDSAGPHRHPTAGVACVGVRQPLVAYNVWLPASVPLEAAEHLARRLRRPGVIRALAFSVGGRPQVSFNLIEARLFGPREAFRAVAEHFGEPACTAELVGLMPSAVLSAVPRAEWEQLDLSEARTIEARLTARSWRPAGAERLTRS
jgi:glutamate formiminotransferase